MFETENWEGPVTITLPPLILSFPQSTTRIKVIRIKPLAATHYLIRLDKNVVAKYITIYADANSMNLEAIVSASKLVATSPEDDTISALRAVLPEIEAAFYRRASARPRVIAAEFGGLDGGNRALIEIVARRGAVKSREFASELRQSLITTLAT